ncbi:MAG: ATP-binding protein [Bacteroidota bacterium]
MPKIEENEKNDPFRSYYSKVNDVYIKLNNYSFFHSSLDTGQIEERFVGRESLVEKLKELLTNNASRSGAYLITGFRGVGKSSLVNKVLSELTPRLFNIYLKKRIFRLYFLVLFFAFLEYV